MTHEEAIDIVRKNYPHVEVSGSQFETALRNLIPELRESEDERTRNEIIAFIEQAIHSGGGTSIPKEKEDKWLAYLEKQKELLFVKDVMLGYPGLYYYDGERMHFQGSAMEEKQKEQKPKEPDWCHHKVDLSGCSEEYMKAYYDGWNNCNQQHSQCKAEQKPAEKQDYSGLNDLERAIHRGFLSAGVENVPVTLIKETAKECLALRPVEWLEEDEVYLQDALWCVEQAVKIARDENEMGVCWSAERWLKSLRPQPHWKPSEEQILAIVEALKYLPNNKDEWMILDTLVDVLRKLM